MDFVSLPAMARILAIDYGKKRTGLAVTDPSQIVPGALATVETKELLDFIKKYVSHEWWNALSLGGLHNPMAVVLLKIYSVFNLLWGD